VQGDEVVSLTMGNRNATSPGVSGVSIDAYCNSNEVQVVIHNVSASAVNLSITIWRAKVRKQ